MALTIGTNIASLRAQQRLTQSSDALSKNFERLSSGLRINHASDDAAGLAVSSQLRTRARVYSQAVRNVNDGISSLNVAEGGLSQLTDILSRLEELASQSANGTVGLTQRRSLDNEAYALTDEYNRLIQSTKFNKRALLDGSNSNFLLQLGYGSRETIGVNVGEGLSRRTNSGTFRSSGNTMDFEAPIMEAADFNGDGKADIVAVAADGSGIKIKLGTADGIGTTSSISTFAASDLTLGDFNGDGVKDFAVIGGGEVRVFVGNGSGGFSAGGTYTASGNKIAAGDFNGDGKDDVGIATSSSTALGIFLNSGNGTFGALRTSNTSSAIADIAIGDANGDGIADLVAGAFDGIYLFGGNGNGALGAATRTSTYLGGQIGLADLNHDGIMDLVGITGAYFAVYTGSTSGTFGAGTEYGAPDNSSTGSFTFADINGDGYQDIVTGQSEATTSLTGLWTNNGSAVFSYAAGDSSPAGTGIYVVAAGDFNGDGAVDLLTDSANVGGFGSSSLQGNVATSNLIQRVNLTTRQEALTALTSIKALRQTISRELGLIGASQSRLNSALHNLHSVRENYTSAASRIEDADIAQEAGELVARNIQQYASSAVLAHANQTPQLVLQLLQSASPFGR
ncbi:MAG: FG-GAP-like repeat-containing protein [Oligoflexia bacterium]|nr:FG-GAP-like repeat-containing protein [Oligoflexia bacterium]